MKSILIFMAALLSFAEVASAEEVVLRKGHAQSPEEARLELQQFKDMYTDLIGWKKREDVIRSGILHGAGLSTLPKKTPLNPKFSNKRAYDGYVVESVAFESSPGFCPFFRRVCLRKRHAHSPELETQDQQC